MSERFQENYVEEVKPKNFSDPKNKIEEQAENGIKHNDLHSGNIMLDNNGNFYIIDFGKAEIIKK